VSALGAWGLGRLLARLGAFPGDATTSPSVAVSAFWLFGFALSMFVAAVFGRWTKRVGAWAGCWIAWSLAGIAAARLVPEAAYMFIGPALVAGLAGAAAVLARGTLAGWLPAVLPVVAAALVWMPPAWLIFHALGAPLLPVIGGAVAVLATGLAPLTADARLAWRWSVPAVSLVASLVVAWMALAAPAFSADRPERMNVTYFLEESAGAARWIVWPQSSRLPAAFRDVAPFGPELAVPFPWATGASAFVAPAAVYAAPAPRLDIVERGSQDGHQTVRARLRSPRGAAVAVVLLPLDRVVAVSIGGKAVPRRPPQEEQRLLQRGPRTSSFRGYACFTLPVEGLAVDIVVSGDEPVEGFVYDQTSGLPASGASILERRPREATSSGFGDTTIIARRITF
jgi:MFS family permease